MAQPIPPHWGPDRDPRSNDGEPDHGDPVNADHLLGRHRDRARAGLLERAPFAWQYGDRLFLLEAGSRSWVLAELRFDPAGCHYAEIRRSRYRWAREAGGALLGRALGAGESVAGVLAADISRWIAEHHGSW